jgi:hypothetical protein
MGESTYFSPPRPPTDEMDAGTEFDAALDRHAGVALDEAIPTSIGWRTRRPRCEKSVWLPSPVRLTTPHDGQGADECPVYVDSSRPWRKDVVMV